MTGYILTKNKTNFKIKKIRILETNLEFKNKTRKEDVKVKINKEVRYIKKEEIECNYHLLEQKIKDEVKKQKGDKCFWCGKIITEKSDYTIDHIIPISKFKKRYKAWKSSNMVVSCKCCNKNKRDRHPNKNIDLMYKAELIKYKKGRRTSKNKGKVSSFLSSKIDNVFQLAKRDSSYYNIKIFFGGKKYIKI